MWQGRWRPQAALTGPLVWGGWGVWGGGVGLSGGSEGEVARRGEMTAPGTGPAASTAGSHQGHIRYEAPEAAAPKVLGGPILAPSSAAGEAFPRPLHPDSTAGPGLQF